MAAGPWAPCTAPTLQDQPRRSRLVLERPSTVSGLSPTEKHKNIKKKMRTGHDMALELVCRAEFWCNRHCRTSLPRSRGVWGPSLAENRPKTKNNTIFDPPYRPLSALYKGLMGFCSTALTVTLFDGERPRPKPRSIWIDAQPGRPILRPFREGPGKRLGGRTLNL